MNGETGIQTCMCVILKLLNPAGLRLWPEGKSHDVWSNLGVHVSALGPPLLLMPMQGTAHVGYNSQLA